MNKPAMAPPEICFVSVMCDACGKSTMGGALVREDGVQIRNIPPEKCLHCGEAFPETDGSGGR